MERLGVFNELHNWSSRRFTTIQVLSGADGWTVSRGVHRSQNHQFGFRE
ncbi:hypothetical protein HanPSC8_Chr06g0239741 [Helianthus annuus]|nr:hypothetical protein HanPSC8_Chr06g0239741 [Helianthus annuus]